MAHTGNLLFSCCVDVSSAQAKLLLSLSQVMVEQVSMSYVITPGSENLEHFKVFAVLYTFSGNLSSQQWTFCENQMLHH